MSYIGRITRAVALTTALTVAGIGTTYADDPTPNQGQNPQVTPTASPPPLMDAVYATPADLPLTGGDPEEKTDNTSKYVAVGMAWAGLALIGGGAYAVNRMRNRD